MAVIGKTTKRINVMLRYYDPQKKKYSPGESFTIYGLDVVEARRKLKKALGIK